MFGMKRRMRKERRIRSHGVSLSQTSCLKGERTPTENIASDIGFKCFMDQNVTSKRGHTKKITRFQKGAVKH